MKYLGAKIRADADTLQEVKRRCAQAQRVHWDLRQVWSDSRMAISEKMRLYQAAVVSVATYGCEAWSLTPEVIRHLRHFNSRSLARIFDIEVEDCARKEPWSLVDSVRIRRIKWLGGVLRRPATDVIRRVVLSYAKVVIRHRRQDRAAADNDAEEQAEPRVTRKGSRQARARVATIRNISVEDEMENALFAVPLRKQHVGSVILDEALPRWATEHQLLALAQDTGRWNYLLLLYL